MGKTYINVVKYLIEGTVEVDGIVEKSDVVGAIFGQTEGLLGSELDLRELQKSGRIGRIEVDIKTKMGKSFGPLTLASSLDKFQTATLAAALETVDRVGPCEARVRINKIEDTRADKRDYVVGRAKELLNLLSTEEIPDSREISNKLRSAVSKEKLRFFGPEKLPCGPDIEKQKEIIVVEGRADVLNMLRSGITNVVALKGSTIPKTVAELTKRKITTAFVDGDRGGDIIVKQLSELGKIDYVAKAPDGKEVEELTQKEILKQLKNKVPIGEFLSRLNSASRRGRSKQAHFVARKETTTAPPRDTPDLTKIYEKIKGTLKAVLVDGDKTIEVGVAEMVNKINKQKKLDAVVFDGIITQRLVDLADEKGIKTLVGLKKAKIAGRKKVNLVVMG